MMSGCPIGSARGPAKGELVWHRPNRYLAGTHAAQPDLCRGIRRMGDGAPRRRPDRFGGSDGREGAPQGSLARLYHLGDLREELCAGGGEPTQSRGVPRGGPALLAGLLVCGRCGRRMPTHYSPTGHDLRYDCIAATLNYGQARCQSLSGRALDALVGGLILEALEPAAVEASVQLAEDVELERTALHRQWRQRLERSRYEVERARRQYDQVEPENRLVARTLERQWEEALANQVRVQDDYDRFLEEQPLPLTPAGLRADPPARRGHSGAVAGGHDHADRPADDRPPPARPCRGHGRGRQRTGVGDLPLGRRNLYRT